MNDPVPPKAERFVHCMLFIVHNSMPITSEEIKKLFELARLPYDESKAGGYKKDMEEILGYVASLARYDTSNAPEVHGGADILNAFRVDEVRPAAKEERDGVVHSFPIGEAGLNKVLGIMGK